MGHGTEFHPVKEAAKTNGNGNGDGWKHSVTLALALAAFISGLIVGQYRLTVAENSLADVRMQFKEFQTKYDNAHFDLVKEVNTLRVEFQLLVKEKKP